MIGLPDSVLEGVLLRLLDLLEQPEDLLQLAEEALRAVVGDGVVGGASLLLLDEAAHHVNELGRIDPAPIAGVAAGDHRLAPLAGVVAVQATWSRVEAALVRTIPA
ncbi:MAG: hypothetical protein JWN52_1301 [Actinomycetia bacterium]|nr:hypothetical protein [Actinomycetes bacterium]